MPGGISRRFEAAASPERAEHADRAQCAVAHPEIVGQSGGRCVWGHPGFRNRNANGPRAFAEGRQVCFEVEDNGIGLDRREARKIFARFYQVDQGLTRQRGGCGLGLSIVKFIVQAHAGVVEVQSQPGQGSIFRVKIPLTTPVISPN